MSIISADRAPAIDAASSAVYQAQQDTADDALAIPSAQRWPSSKRPPLTEPHDVSQSLSVGTIRDGSLKAASALPHDHRVLQVIERHRSRGTHYGTDEMVDALMGAASSVYDHHGGAPLRVGNIGFRSGGSIPWSVSHQAGRDADIAFYALDADGQSVPTPDLITFDDEGYAPNHGLYFDAPRNWHFIRSLLTDPTIKVQWFFLSEALKAKLIEHAIDIDEDPELITRAAHTLHQPTDALPHDDHLHLRLGCTTEDRLRGCVDWGPQWPWHQWSRPALFAQASTAIDAVRSGDKSASKLLEFLESVHSPYAPAFALSVFNDLDTADEDILDRLESIFTHIRLQHRASLTLLAEHLDRASHNAQPQLVELFYSALRLATADGVETLVIHRALDERRSHEERLLAIQALDHQDAPSLIPHLLTLMGDSEYGTLRQAAADELYRISARHDGLSWDVDRLRDRHLAALDRWAHWYHSEHPTVHSIQRDLLATLEITEWPDLGSTPAIITALRNAPDWQAYHLNRILSDWTDRWAPHHWDSPVAGARFWQRWWQRNEDRLLDDRPRPWLPYLIDI